MHSNARIGTCNQTVDSLMDAAAIIAQYVCVCANDEAGAVHAALPAFCTSSNRKQHTSKGLGEQSRVQLGYR